MRDLIGRELKRSGADDATLAALALWYRPNLISRNECDTASPLNRTWAKLIDREKLFFRAEPRQDCRDPFELRAVLWVRTRKDLPRLLKFVPELVEVPGNRGLRNYFPMDPSVGCRKSVERPRRSVDPPRGKGTRG